MLKSCVNTLTRVFSISTGRHIMENLQKNMCQYPYSGLLHFYGPILWQKKLETGCVNTLTRVFSISTATWLEAPRSNTVCQYPYSGLLHFYAFKGGKEVVEVNMCQYPYSGLLHFYAPFSEPSWILGCRGRFCIYFGVKTLFVSFFPYLTFL